MEKFKQITEKLFAALVLIAMMINSISPITQVLAAEGDATEESNEYYSFTANWASSGEEEANVNSSTSVNIDYGLTLTAGAVFKNLKISAEDITGDDTLPSTTIKFAEMNNATVSASGTSLTFDGTLNSGYQTSGAILLNFGRTADYSVYDKTIKVRLTGEYEINGKTTEIDLEKELVAHVTPSPTVDAYSAYSKLDYLKTEYDNMEYYSPVKWRAHKFTQKYMLTYNSVSEVYTNIKLNISRTSPQNIALATLNNEDNLTISVANQDIYESEGYSFNIVRESDGTTYLEITCGNPIDESNISATETRNERKVFYVDVTYNVAEDVTVLGSGATLVTATLNTNSEGITTVVSAEGTKYNKATYSYSSANEVCVTIYSNPNGNSPGNMYNTWLRTTDMEEEVYKEALEYENLTISFYTNIMGVIGVEDEPDENRLRVYNNKGTTIRYKNGEDYYTEYLTDNELTLKEINVYSFGETTKSIEFYKEGDVVGEDDPFYTATGIGVYTIPEGEEITGYFAVANGYNKAYPDWQNVAKWKTDWNVDTSAIAEKIGSTNLKNIREFTKNQNSKFLTIGSETTLDATVQGQATFYINNNEDRYFSYGYLELYNNYSGSTAKFGKWETNKKFTIYFRDNVQKYYKTLKNVNPKVYVELPGVYDYRNFKVDITGSNSYVKDYHTETINDKTFLVIEIAGSDASSITVTHMRRLNTETPSAYQNVNAYLLTDNGGYAYNKTVNSYNFTKEIDGETVTPSYACIMSDTFNIETTSAIEIGTLITKNNKEYKPGITDGVANISSKTNPLKVEAGNVVKYKNSISTKNSALTSIDIIARLPVAGNTPITTSSYQMDSTATLTNLNNIKLEVNGSEIDSSKYKIYAGTSGTENFTSEMQLLSEVTDLSTVKTLRVKFNDDYRLTKGSKINFTYEMTMPDADGISGAVTAVKYEIYQQSNSETVLESVPAYVTKGSPTGTINIQKKFQGYSQGTAPAGLSLQGIKFKFINTQTNEVLVLDGQTDAEGIVETDAQGKITLTNVPEGIYSIKEVTEFDRYEGIIGTSGEDVYSDILIENGETSPESLVVENQLKRGQLKIQKEWNDTNDQQGNVRFTVTRDSSSDGVEYTRSASTVDGVATFEGLPYGNYTVSEITSVFGWNAADIIVDVNAEVVTATVENQIMKDGMLTITKSVPADEDIKEITFNIVGKGVSYINKEGTEVKNNVNYRVNIGECYTTPIENVSVTLNSSNEATITIANLPYGDYTITEVEIPEIGDTGILKYSKKEQQTIVSDTPAQVDFVNVYKTGTLKIHKTAELKEGTKHTEIGDLSQFKVRIQGTSHYGHEVDMLVGLNENGYAEMNLEIGEYTITEQAVDGYTTYYGENALASTEPAVVNITAGSVITQEIYNQHTGIGYVRVEKSLEGITDPQEVVDAGIQFQVLGKNIAGGDVNETITINKIDQVKNVAYGISNGISVGGEYELQEVEETVPDYFEAIDPIEVDLTTANTIVDPLVIEAENKRGIGNLEITTETIPAGGTLSPIRYSVTEVTINDDYSYTEVGETTELTATNGYSEMKNIYAGFYLVKQLEIPQGYIMDQPQLVEVPISATGYAYFQIEKPESLNATTLTIEKEILNSEGEAATEEDFENAQLDENVSFEVKLTNVNTSKTYYTFISSKENGKITGIEPGTYEIEEVYKPRYLNTGYYLKTQDEYTQIEAQEEKYYVEIPELTDEETSVSVTIKIQNKINTNFGFGGGSTADNLSVVTFERINSVTKTLIVITDEAGNALPGAQFKLYDANGKEMQLPFENNTYTTTDQIKVLINGLPVGTYTLKNISVPDGYVTAEDVQITVYSGATQVRRVEIWKNVPRGSLILSTSYTNDDGESKYVSRSKYKILSKSTNQVLTFEKTASGNYIRSKQETATDTISLKAGTVTVTGIEVGDYELGLVDLPSKYGVINEDVENITITENATVSKDVKVKERVGLKKVVVDGDNSSTSEMYALREDGKLYFYKANAAAIKNEMLDIKYLYPEMADVTFADIECNENNCLCALDTSGRLWINGECLSDSAEDPFYGKEIALFDVVDQGYRGPGLIALDIEGKLWYYGYEYSSLGMGKVSSGTTVTTPVCISEGTILEDKQIVSLEVGYYSAYAIDSNGNVYAWGYDNKNIGYETTEDYKYITEPVCLTTLTGCNLKNIQIKQVSNEYYNTYFIDYDNNLWVCGKNEYGGLGIGETAEDTKNPVCLTKLNGNALYGKQIEYVNSSYNSVGVIDSDGKLWTWGQEYYGSLGTGNSSSSNIYVPTCITDLDSNNLQTVELTMLSLCRYYGCAVDNNGDSWIWGYFDEGPLGYDSDRKLETPSKINFAQNSYFDLFEFDSASIGYNQSIIQDTSGKLWVSGNTSDTLLTYSNYNINGKSITSYNSSELGSNIENITVKDYVCGKDSSLIIGTNGELWCIGALNGPYITDNSSYLSNYQGKEQMKPLCLTSTEGCALYGKKIKYASVSKNSDGCAAVIDEDGKLYVAGRGDNEYAAKIGDASRSSTTYYTKFVCLNNIYQNLANVKFTKVDMGSTYSSAVAVDEDGKVWTWGLTGYSAYNGYSPSGSSSYTLGVDVGTGYAYRIEYSNRQYYCITPTVMSTIPTNAKIVDAKVGTTGGIALDENGEVYIWGSQMGFGASSSYVPLALSGRNTPLEGKRFVKIGYGDGFITLLDTEGEMHIIGTVNGTNYTYIPVFSAINDTVKDFYVGYNTIAIKGSDNSLYQFGEGTPLYAASGFTNLSVTYSNALLGESVDKVIDSNSFAIKNDDGTVKILSINTSNYTETGSIQVSSVSQVINKASVTAIITNEGQVYTKSPAGYAWRTNENIKFSKVISSTDSAILAEDTNGKLFYITNSAVTSTDIEVEDVLYEGDNLVLINDVDGNLYKLSTYGAVVFKQVTGFDEGTKIVRAWGYKYQTTDVIVAQDENNVVWYCEQNQAGTGKGSISLLAGAGIAGATTDLVVTPQKVISYTGNELKDVIFLPGNRSWLSSGSSYIYGGVTVFYWDSSNNVWGAQSCMGQLVTTVTDVKEIVCTTCGVYTQTLMLKNNGDVYSVGTVQQWLNNSIRSPLVGIAYNSNPFTVVENKNAYAYIAINLSKWGGTEKMGKVSHLYKSTQKSTSIYTALSANDVYAYTEDESAKYILKVDQDPYLADLDEADTQILAELNGTATATTTADTIPTGTFTDTEGNTFNYADAKQVYGDYILMNNGTLFKYNSTKVAYENITRKYLTTNAYSRRFELLKDSKYNN